MSSYQSRSSKELSRALYSFFQTPSLPLPSELVAVISAYLDKHQKFDEGAADRLNEELVSIYDKLVYNRPSKYASILIVLRKLQPAFHTSRRTFEWWNKLLDPVLESVESEKGLAREVLDYTYDLLLLDQNNEPAEWNEAGLSPFIDRLLSRWMELMSWQADARSVSSDLKEKVLTEALLVFGKKDPKGFMTALDGYMVKKVHRNHALSLLCTLVANQPPHMHLILQTPLFVNILHSLQRDESTSTVNGGLLSLIMILPFIPSSIVSYLPTLFNIYARMLFWDKDSVFALEHTEFQNTSDDFGGRAGAPWEKCLLDPDHDGMSVHYLPGYFTILYGLYPINFVDYIRKPHRYLRHANNAENIDVQAMEIRDRSGRFREMHRLHPNFYNLTIETEKTDFSRWMKSEPDEVLADCVALCISKTDDSPEEEIMDVQGLTDDSAPMEDADVDDSDSPLLSGSAYSDVPLLGGPSSVNITQPTGGRESIKSRRSQSSIPPGHEPFDARTRELGGDSPTLPPHLIQSSSHAQLQDMIYSNKAIKSTLNQSLANNSVPSLSLGPQELMAGSGSMHRPQPRSSANSAQVSVRKPDHAAHFYHQRLLLLNDLQFERYIKQQHMTHMGELRRKQIREAATEAETQHLLMANRSLRQRLDEAKRQEVQIKKEFDHRRSMAQKRENDLSAKLRTLREEQKKWSVEGAMLKEALERAQVECEKLRTIISQAEEKRLKSEQDLEAIDLNTDEIERLKAEIARLSEVEHEYQGKQLKIQSAAQVAEAAASRAEQWRRDLAAREQQLQQARTHYEGQIATLNSKLSEALKNKQQGRASEITAVYENALATSHARHAELQKQFSSLMRKYTVLQSSLLDMQCDVADKSRNDGGSSSYGAASGEMESMPAMPGSPIAIRNRAHRGFSDPEVFDNLSHNTTTPLEVASTSVGSGGHHQPLSPLDVDKLAAGAGAGVGTSTSPQLERYFGRGKLYIESLPAKQVPTNGLCNTGGVQNRKEKKDDKADKKDKKEKKSGAGIRGMRF